MLVTKESLKLILESNYNLEVEGIQIGPRQFVAETFIIDSNKGRYFCKITDKDLFVPNIISSLPALNAMHEAGFERSNYPIKTINHDLFIMHDGVLMVLFNYIDAPQNYDYETRSLGKLLAQLHEIKISEDVVIPIEKYNLRLKEQFNDFRNRSLNYDGSDALFSKLKSIISEYKEEIEKDLEYYFELQELLKSRSTEFVITHGDAGGNTLVKEKDDLYLIDWDDILKTNAERDIWNFYLDEEFLKGYMSVRTNFKIDIKKIKYFALDRYFSDMTHYFQEIYKSKDNQYIEKNINELNDNFFKGWFRPLLRKLMELKDF